MPSLRKSLDLALLAGLIVWGPAYRALLDKLWMQHANLQTVGQWAQLQSVAELITAPVQAGIAMGLTVLVSQSRPQTHAPLYLAACGLGLVVSLPLLWLMTTRWLPVLDWLALDPGQSDALRLAALAAWCSIIPGLLTSVWIGRHQRGRVMLVYLAGAAPPILALSVGQHAPTSPLESVLGASLGIQVLFIIGILIQQWRSLKVSRIAVDTLYGCVRRLGPYLIPGLSIGICSPLSGLMIRRTLAQQLDWDSAGAATAIWRVSDWVLGCASGALYFYLLPLLSPHIISGRLNHALRRMLRQVWLPSLVVLLALFELQSQLFPLFYDSRLVPDRDTIALFWLGDALRILAAIGLVGLYALQAGKTIATGELLSQPLLALLLLLGAGQSLFWTGAAHVVSYAIYAAFNLGSLALIYSKSSHLTTLGTVMSRRKGG
jgi:hypothetical protein